ncbi:ExbD/TolR family protein [Erythrobacter sp. HA6-11]
MTSRAQPTVDTTENVLAITKDDAVLWNGEQVGLLELEELLERTKEPEVQPRLLMVPDPAASFERSAEILAIIKESGVTKYGFLGIERYPAGEDPDS